MKTRTILLTLGAGSMLLYAYVAATSSQGVNRDAFRIQHASHTQKEPSALACSNQHSPALGQSRENQGRISSGDLIQNPNPHGVHQTRESLTQAMTQARSKSLRLLRSSHLSLPASLVISDQSLIPDSQEDYLIKLAQQFQSKIDTEITSPRTDTIDATDWLDAKDASDLQFRIRYGKQAWLSHHIAAQHLLLQKQER